MTKLNLYRITTTFLVATIVILSILLCNKCCKTETNVTFIHDTVKVTEFVDKIKYVDKYDTAFVTHFDTIYNNDTLNFTDTVYVEIPIEHKISHFDINKDSVNISGNISYHGFKAEIDSVDLDYKFVYDVPKIKKQRWHISLQGGYYTGYNVIDGQIYSGPGVGLGISYDLW